MKKRNGIWEGWQRRNRRWARGTAVMAILIAVLSCVMMVYGHTVYSPGVILRVLSGEQIQGASYTILKVRLPRLLAAVFSGMAFGMAGFIFQSVLRNSLASPDIIGVSSSTSTAAVFCISLLGMDGISVPVIAVFTGIAVSLLIYFLASRGGFSHTRMILIGIGVQALVRAVSSYILSKVSEYDMANTMRWMSGSLNYAQMEEGIELVLVAALGGLILLVLSGQQRILELGDEYAKTLGAAASKAYPALIGAAVLMVAFGTAAVGPISSVSFLAGPVAVRVTGRSKSGLLPSALAGALLVLASDLAGQFLFPSRYPVGIITGLLGGPYLLYLLVTMNRKGERV